MNKVFSVSQKKNELQIYRKENSLQKFSMRMSCKSKIHFIWETLLILQFCFRYDISTNERVQCNKFSKSQEKIKGKRKLSQFLISDFCFASLHQLAAVCSAASSSIAANWLGSTTHESGRGKQNALRRLSVSIPRHTPNPPLSRGLWLILGQRVSQRHLTEREGQRETERHKERRHWKKRQLVGL